MATPTDTTPAPGAQPDSRAAEHFAAALALYMKARLELIVQPPSETDEDEKEMDRLADALTAAEEYVMAHGAPDWNGLLAKLEIATYDSCHPKPDYVDSIKSDIMRLASLDRSPTFLPLEWLDRFERAGGKATIIKREDELVRVLGCPTDREHAAHMLRELEDHERAAIGEHLRQHLDPADFGFERET